MNVALWSAQVLLALLFGFVAGCELLAIVGLIGPQATGIARILAPFAALGLIIIMVFAARDHLALYEPRTAVGNLVIAGVCVFVAVGRYVTNQGGQATSGSSPPIAVTGRLRCR